MGTQKNYSGAGSTLNKDWIRILHPEVLARLGKIRHVLFDFDGTLSVLRQGWEEVMVPVMVESICGTASRPEIEKEVNEYVDHSTGILTIRQMQWLVDSVKRHGLVTPALTAAEYKALYLSRLMVFVRERIAQVKYGEVVPAEHLVAGSQEFVSGLVERGARLYLASGTDHADVAGEAEALGLLEYFHGDVYGALDHNENHAKERVIQRILDENGLSGDELLIIGDGPVEIREGALRKAVTLGVASDEVARQGWNERKVERLQAAGADLLVADFIHVRELLALFFEPPMPAHP
ncbi:MAG: HAD family hydrolase [Anaerolineaceae bacterium]|nr:HAD family hydrolase [Anaerolineaceae bacterium]